MTSAKEYCSRQAGASLIVACTSVQLITLKRACLTWTAFIKQIREFARLLTSILHLWCTVMEFRRTILHRFSRWAVTLRYTCRQWHLQTRLWEIQTRWRTRKAVQALFRQRLKPLLNRRAKVPLTKQLSWATSPCNLERMLVSQKIKQVRGAG